MLGEKVAVLMAAGGAAWEVEALQMLSSPSAAAVLLKRCLDLPDLLASAATGQARVAVVANSLDGLDTDSIAHLRRSGVGVVLVTSSGPGANEPLGAAEIVPATAISGLGSAVVAAADNAGRAQPGPAGPAETSSSALPADQDGAEPAATGRVVAIWGPTGAPGRTTVAVGIAAELAARGHDTLLVDADGYGGAVAQHLAVLDEVSGLLSAVRLANAGRLDLPLLASAARSVSPSLRVLTGLPRAERWVEVRGPAFDTLLETARRLSEFVVLDLGFGLEQDPVTHGSSAPQRNQMTLAGLDHADDVVVVGAADPVGLTRLARALVALREHGPVATMRVVVNRMRPSVGWGEGEVQAMVEQFATASPTHFLPEDQPTADRALVAGRAPAELGDSPLGAALGRLVDSLDGGPRPAARRSRSGFRLRRARRAR